MTAADPGAAYVRLGLSAARLDPAVLDCWVGDPAVRPVTLAAREIAERAEQLRDELGDLPPLRRAWLHGALTGLATWSRRQAGEQLPHEEYVARLYGVRPAFGEVERYADTHRRLAVLLPGTGPLAGRYAAYLERTAVPPALLPRALAAVVGWLRSRTAERLTLPAGEHVELSVGPDVDGGGFQTWHGQGRSSVALNSALPVPFGRLVQIAAHETYPGHHVHRVRAEAAWGGQPEAALALTCTPDCTLLEGIGEAALRGLGIAHDWGVRLQPLADELGLRVDGPLAQQVLGTYEELAGARQDLALLLHARGASTDQATAYAGRWLLLPPERAARQVEFVQRHGAYTSTYAQGARLVHGYLDAAPDEEAAWAALLDRQLVPATLGGPGRVVPAADRCGP